MKKLKEDLNRLVLTGSSTGWVLFEMAKLITMVVQLCIFLK